MGDARGSRVDCLPSGMRERQALCEFADCCNLRVDQKVCPSDHAEIVARDAGGGHLWFTRHSLRIFSMAARVVNCLFASISTVSRLRAISQRRPETVMPPIGNASATASASRNGVSGPILVGAKESFIRIICSAFGIRPLLPFGHHQLKEATEVVRLEAAALLTSKCT